MSDDLHKLAGEASERILLYFDNYRIGGMAPIVSEIEVLLKAERERCVGIVRAKKPPGARLWWLRDELESLAKEIEDGR